MRESPSWTQAYRYPVVAGTAGLAILATACWWMGRDIGPLVAGPEIVHGQVWRLVTSALPHGGIFHLVFNLYWLWVFGTLVESVYGHLRTAAMFIALAVVSSAMEYAILDGGVGLSGVGYGLFGYLWVAGRRDSRFADAVTRQTVALFLGWFVLCIFATVSGIMPIGNIAHATGCIAGVLLAFAATGSLSAKRWPTYAVGAVLLLLSASAILLRPHINLSPNAGVEEGHLAYVALGDDRVEDAVAWGRRAVQLAPKNASYWFNLGIAYQRLNRLKDAADAYHHALAIRPDDRALRDAVNNLAYAADSNLYIQPASTMPAEANRPVTGGPPR